MSRGFGNREIAARAKVDAFSSSHYDYDKAWVATVELRRPPSPARRAAIRAAKLAGRDDEVRLLSRRYYACEDAANLRAAHSLERKGLVEFSRTTPPGFHRPNDGRSGWIRRRRTVGLDSFLEDMPDLDLD